MGTWIVTFAIIDNTFTMNVMSSTIAEKTLTAIRDDTFTANITISRYPFFIISAQLSCVYIVLYIYMLFVYLVPFILFLCFDGGGALFYLQVWETEGSSKTRRSTPP